MARFYNYPTPKEGPKVPYAKKKDENPTLRGIPLVILAWIVSKAPLIQNILYHNAGFSRLRGLKELKDYDCRYDPTVIPLDQSTITPPTSYPTQRKDLPGRYTSIADYHALYTSGEITPLAVAESLLPFILRDKRSKHATAFVDCHAEEILEAARESTARYQAGKPLSMFDGVPIGIKDEYDIKGYSTCSGRKAHDKLFPSKDASGWLVQLWQDAGGIILGKLHMHQVGADTNGNNPTWGTPLNPHNSSYYTGGSSSGAAYAVASGLIPIALGTDGGGSIRIPSSFCGLYGLKPSHNRLDNTGSTMTVNGPIAATMSDLMATYRLFTKPNPADPICSAFTTPAPQKTRKIGYPRVWFSQSDPSVLEHCNNAVDYFQKLGYELIDVEIPFLPEGQLAQAYSILTEMTFGAKKNPVPNSNFLTAINPAEKILLATGSQTSAYDYLLAQSLRNLLMQHLAFLYQQHPGLIILTPTTPMAGWPIDKPSDLTHGVSDANTSLRNMTYVWLANFCGNPAISVPVGYVDPVKGMGKIPIGLMAMGEWGAEEQLLEWGSEAETYLNEVYGGRIRAENWEDIIEAAKMSK